MPSWFSRVLRSLSLVSKPADPPALHASYTGDIGVQPGYDTAAASAAPAAFSWLYAAFLVKCGAGSGLPIKVYRSVKGKRKELPDHWLIKLLERPNRSTDGVVFRREILADLSGHGNEYTLIGGMERRKAGGLQLYRMHPDYVTLVQGEYGIRGYQYDVNGRVTVYDPSTVLHIRQPAFSSGPTRIGYGVGGVEPLKRELIAEWDAVGRAGTNFKRGRPDVFLMPAEGKPDWSTQARDEVNATYNRLAQNGGGMALSQRIEIKETTFSPQDLEGSALRDRTRQGVIAVTGVPPVMLGLETANFATAREQTSTFWTRLSFDLALIDSGIMTELLRRAGEDDTYAEHDVSGVPALQAWRTEAWQRTQTAVFAGVPLDIALESEGLGDVAERMREVGPVAPEAAPVTLESWWTRAATEPEDILPPQDEAGRDTYWRAWIERAHAPAERGLNARILAYLVEARNRVAANLEKVWPIADNGKGLILDSNEPVDGLTRAMHRKGAADEEAIVNAIFDDADESKRLSDMLTPLMRSMLRDACIDALKQLAKAGVELTPERINELVDKELASLIVTRAMPGDRIALVTQSTRDACATLVRKGLEEGATIGEMTARIQLDEGFSPARALRIARTETTRAVNAGTLAAYDASEVVLGVEIQREWLASRDTPVSAGGPMRDAHGALDGRRVKKGEMFVVPDVPGVPAIDVGLKTAGPGQWGLARHDCNDRCGLAPVVIRAKKEATA